MSRASVCVCVNYRVYTPTRIFVTKYFPNFVFSNIFDTHTHTHTLIADRDKITRNNAAATTTTTTYVPDSFRVPRCPIPFFPRAAGGGFCPTGGEITTT